MVIRQCLSRSLLLTCIALLGFGGVGLMGGCAARSPADRDRTGDPPFFSSDVVIAVDRAALALLASGVDVDEDGVVGRTRSWVAGKSSDSRSTRNWTTDDDDAVAALQLKVAGALVPRLADRGNRVGLASLTLRPWQRRTRGTGVVQFTERRPVVAPVGPPAAVLAALNRLPTVHVKAQTDLSRLLEIAAELLDKAPPLETKRRRAILLLSLGEPSAPHGVYWSSREAVNYAHELGRRGISIWAVPFALANVEYLNELTRSTGGRVVDLEELNAFFGVPLVMTPATGTTSSTGQP